MKTDVIIKVLEDFLDKSTLQTGLPEAPSTQGTLGTAFHIGKQCPTENSQCHHQTTTLRFLQERKKTLLNFKT